MDPFCALNNYAFNANITVNCDSTASPTSPTSPPTTTYPTTGYPTTEPTNPTKAPTRSPTVRQNRTLCGTNTWCYYLDLYPSSTRKKSQTAKVNTIIENVQTFHKIFVRSVGNDCIDPRIDVIYEVIDFSSTTEYFDVLANGSFISRCDGGLDGQCGVWNTCLDNYSLPIIQINEDDTYLIEIQGSTGLNDLCLGSGNDYALNAEVTITCSIAGESLVLINV